MISIKLKKKPKNVRIIEGFPGFGLVGTIATEFLLEHLGTEQIGEFVYDVLPPTIALHKGKLVHPMGVHYVKKYNLVVLHTLLNTKGEEWSIAETIAKMASSLSAKEIISLEGVNALIPTEEPSVFYYGNPSFAKCGAEPLKEGIIIGVTASLMLRVKKVSCLFAETHSALPDSKAAAKIVEVLNNYLKLGLDTKPLLEQAIQFEHKLKTILEQTGKATQEADKKALSYLG
ncbi:proteasome assembly chaperone family protein [Candidatus Woesearchaeota archaeon]|nr:MAG: proteasome assembly chaperone family protein [Candidatus Woesearchaeota archaeon]